MKLLPCEGFNEGAEIRLESFGWWLATCNPISLGTEEIKNTMETVHDKDNTRSFCSGSSFLTRINIEALKSGMLDSHNNNCNLINKR